MALSMNQMNVAMAVALIVVVSIPPLGNFIIESLKENESSFVGLAMCTDGKTSVSTPIYSDSEWPKSAILADGTSLPCSEGSVLVAN